MSRPSPSRYFKTSPENIRLAVTMYVRFPPSLRKVEDLLHECGIEISHETVRRLWNRFGPMFAAEIRRRRIDRMRAPKQAVRVVEAPAAMRGLVPALLVAGADGQIGVRHDHGSLSHWWPRT